MAVSRCSDGVRTLWPARTTWPYGVAPVKSILRIVKWPVGREQGRRYPQRTRQADLIVTVAGVFIAVLGGFAAVAGSHPRATPGASPNTAAGTAVLVVGLIVFALGVALVVANAVLFLASRARGGRTTTSD